MFTQWSEAVKSVIPPQYHPYIPLAGLTAAMLARLRTLAPQMSMVGLSATVRDPDELRRWLAAISERFFLLQGRHSPRREIESRNLARKASLKIRLPMPKIGRNGIFTLHYQADLQQRSLLQRCPLQPRPGSAVSSCRGVEKRRKGRMRWGRTYLL
jgi:hypothetical protein